MTRGAHRESATEGAHDVTVNSRTVQSHPDTAQCRSLRVSAVQSIALARVCDVALHRPLE